MEPPATKVCYDHLTRALSRQARQSRASRQGGNARGLGNFPTLSLLSVSPNPILFQWVELGAVNEAPWVTRYLTTIWLRNKPLNGEEQEILGLILAGVRYRGEFIVFILLYSYALLKTEKKN